VYLATLIETGQQIADDASERVIGGFTAHNGFRNVA